jgi:hypothetical protein
MDEKVKDLIGIDARFTSRYIAKCVGISVGATHTILRHDLRMRWIYNICHMLRFGLEYPSRGDPPIGR